MSARRIVSVLCTLGPSSLNRSTIERLQARGVDLFRINLSHTPLDRVAETIETIQSFSSVPVCLDTEGAQVRTGTLAANVEIQDRQHVALTFEPVVGDGSRFALTPPSVFDDLKPNTLIGVDFDGVVLLVLERTPDGVNTVVLTADASARTKQ